MKHILLLIMLLSSCLVSGQKYPIYDPSSPEVIRIWNRVADFSPLLRSVECARLSPDGEFAVSASKFGYNLMMWRVADGSLIWSKKEEAEIECVVFSPDGKVFATGDENFSVKVRSTATGEVIKALETDKSVDGITWSHNGKIIAAGSEKGDVWFWDARDFTLLEKINVGSTVNSLDFSLDDQSLVVGGNIQTPDPAHNTTIYSGFVKLIDVPARQVIREYKGLRGSVKSVRFSAKEKFIACGGFDSTAHIFDTESGALVKTIPTSRKLEAVEFTPDGNYLLTGGHARKISFYRLSDFSLAYELHCPRTEYIDFSSDGRLLLTAHEDSGLLSLYMMLSSVGRIPGLYQKIEREVLSNRDVKE